METPKKNDGAKKKDARPRKNERCDFCRDQRRVDLCDGRGFVSAEVYEGEDCEVFEGVYRSVLVVNVNASDDMWFVCPKCKRRF